MSIYDILLEIADKCNEVASQEVVTKLSLVKDENNNCILKVVQRPMIGPVITKTAIDLYKNSHDPDSKLHEAASNIALRNFNYDYEKQCLKIDKVKSIRDLFRNLTIQIYKQIREKNKGKRTSPKNVFMDKCLDNILISIKDMSLEDMRLPVTQAIKLIDLIEDWANNMSETWHQIATNFMITHSGAKNG